jgi:3-phenylpropionate/trans-cinnamate dioxygenase ferredoxin reductase subunit
LKIQKVFERGLMNKERYVIIGAGHAGGRAVEAMRMAGFEGDIVLVGAEQHLPYERPPLSKEVLQAQPGYEFPYIRSREYYDEQRIQLRLGIAATSIATKEKSVTLADSEQLSFDKLLLTTGGSVRHIQIPGADQSGVYYLRTLEDSIAIESNLAGDKNIVVIGGGFIGLEVAASARQRGCNVIVLEIADRLLGRGVPPSVSNYFLKLHQSHDVDIRLNTGVQSIEGNTHLSGVVTSDGELLPADLVIIGVGIVPETKLAEQAKLKIDNGIVVNEFCQTSDPSIFAAGDVTNHFNPFVGRHIRLEAWQCAQNMAIAAAKIMCGHKTPYVEVPWMWSDQFDSNLQVAGMPESWEDIVTRGDTASGKFTGFVLRDGKISGAISVNQPRDLRLVRRMMDAGKSYSAEELADESISMRELSKR